MTKGINKRTEISLEQKVQIMRLHEIGKSYNEIAQILRFKKTSIANIVQLGKNTDYTKLNKERKRIKLGTFYFIEKKLISCVNQRNLMNLPTTGDMMRNFGVLLAARTIDRLTMQGVLTRTDTDLVRQCQEFKASEGWLERFKKRVDLKSYKISGEAGSANMDLLKNQLLEFNSIISRYQPCNVYNCDETGVFYREGGSRTLAQSIKDIAGMKKDKSRVTILLCTNVTGSSKQKPFVIARFKRPRCLRNVNIPALGVQYGANNNAWMTRELFESWIQKFDATLTKESLVILDNASVHIVDTSKLHFLRLLYLPPNTTSIAQPLDMGIIKSFKDSYKRNLMEFKMKGSVAFDSDDDIIQHPGEQISLKDALKIIGKTWLDVDPKIINDCFYHSPLFTPTELLLSDADIEMNSLEKQCTREFIPLSFPEAVESLLELGDGDNEPENCSDDLIPNVEECISMSAGLAHLENARKFMKQEGEGIGVCLAQLLMIDNIIDAVKKSLLKSRSQSKLTSFFTKL